MSDEESDKPQPVVTEQEIERIIKELEKREIEKKRSFEEDKKRIESEEKEKVKEEAKRRAELEKQRAFPKGILTPFPEHQAPTEAIQKPTPKPTPALSPESKNPIKTFLKYFLLYICLALAFYFGLNFKAYFLKTKYTYTTNIKHRPAPSVVLPTIPETQEINLPDSLIIQKIQVEAPISWQVEEPDILLKLKDGLVHLKGTAMPNEEGNVAITGHSSSYPWQETKYGQVFSLLDKLSQGDEIVLVYKKKKYLYKVTDKKIIKPDQVEIINTKEAKLTLITCWPVGTALRRLVILAQQAEKPKIPLIELYLPIAP